MEVISKELGRPRQSLLPPRGHACHLFVERRREDELRATDERFRALKGGRRRDEERIKAPEDGRRRDADEIRALRAAMAGRAPPTG